MGWISDWKQHNDIERIQVLEVKTETAKAILCVFADQSEHWIPKSVIDEDSEVFDQEHGKGELIVQRWFAEKEGLTDG
jgi:hypothetical protein